MAGTTLSALLRSGLRTVEVGATDLHLARSIARRGNARYLCLAELDPFASPADGGAAYVAPYTAERQISANNAEVLVLSGATPRALWRIGAFGHASFVALPLAATWATAVGMLCMAKQMLRGRVGLAGIERFPTGQRGGRVLLLARVTRPKPPGARRYVSPVLGVHGFLEGLADRAVRHVVLRWFERLPELDPGEDIDLLVADEHVGAVEEAIAALPGTIPCDLYSVSGLQGTESEGMAYYPPALAEQILARSRAWSGRYRVPSGPDHFLSLAYHAVYRKGVRSGLPTLRSDVRRDGPPEHDYAATLARLARENGIAVELTLEGLDACLASRGWRPPHDTLIRLSLSNRWLARRMEELVERAEVEHRGLAVFVVREVACALGLGGQVVECLRAAGFTILRERLLGGEARSRVLHGVRGGNWGKGPWPRSGGGPAMLVVALDPSPVRPGAEVRERYPGLSNERVLAKERIRHALNEGLAPDERCNMLHSSDNASEAVEYLRLAMPDEMDALLGQARSCREHPALAVTIEGVALHQAATDAPSALHLAPAAPAATSRASAGARP